MMLEIDLWCRGNTRRPRSQGKVMKNLSKYIFENCFGFFLKNLLFCTIVFVFFQLCFPPCFVCPITSIISLDYSLAFTLVKYGFHLLMVLLLKIPFQTFYLAPSVTLFNLTLVQMFLWPLYWQF